MSRTNVTEIVIGILAVVSIILVAIESLVPISQDVLVGIYIADLLICIVFAWDFIMRLKASDSKSHFMKTNGYEIVAMVPAVALYALGTIPAIAVALRSLRLLRVVRVVLLIARVIRLMSKTGKFVQRSNLLTLLGVTVCIIFIGAFAALVLDSGIEKARITNFADAVWWSVSTVTTVGYGDVVPASIAGRIMGMFLMIVGIGVMTTFISEISATLVESRLKQYEDETDFRTAVVLEIKNRIDNIDKLTDSEMSLLIQTIQLLRQEKAAKA